MPVHALHVIMTSTTSRLLLVVARDAEGRSGKTGLSPDSPGAGASFVREGEAARAIPLVPGEVGMWTSGGFVEVDAGLMPGVYQFGAPDGMLAAGSTRALLLLRFDDAMVDPIEIDLVAYDPQDEKCIGMAQLSDERRHQFLRQALPRLTEQELELGRQTEAELQSRLSARAAD
jgi:hypothetical protein